MEPFAKPLEEHQSDLSSIPLSPTFDKLYLLSNLLLITRLHPTNPPNMKSNTINTPTHRQVSKSLIIMLRFVLKNDITPVFRRFEGAEDTGEFCFAEEREVGAFFGGEDAGEEADG